MWDTYRRDFGPVGDPTCDFNPDLAQKIIDRAMERDPAAASAEYMAEFLIDVETFIAREAVQAYVNLGIHERAPERAHSYVAFVDPLWDDANQNVEEVLALA